MNAGCHGSETREFVERVDTIDRQGAVRARTAREFETGYRHVALKRGALGTDEWFIGAWFRFPRGDGTRARERLKALLDKRLATQPLNLPNAGSVFRNPSDDHAARLVEACGLKGYAIGNARISEKHANFIVNAREGLGGDIEALIAHARKAVRQRFGIDLVPEIRILGVAL
jgi:UDP-N-acetylmuramate dehydrogenase